MAEKFVLASNIIPVIIVICGFLAYSILKFAEPDALLMTKGECAILFGIIISITGIVSFENTVMFFRKKYKLSNENLKKNDITNG